MHVYYANKTAPGINLDVDDVTSYGPETVTIGLNQVQHGIYTYYVHRYAGTGTLGTSGANVKVYSGSQLVKEFNVPSSVSGIIWNVFRINTETRQIEAMATAAPQSSQITMNTAIDNTDSSTVNDELETIMNDIETNKK